MAASFITVEDTLHLASVRFEGRACECDKVKGDGGKKEKDRGKKEKRKEKKGGWVGEVSEFLLSLTHFHHLSNLCLFSGCVSEN